MSKFIKIAFVFCFVSCGWAHLSAANELKFAVMDMQRALQTVDAGRKAKAELEKEFNKKKAELQNEEASIKKLAEEFQKQALALSDQARVKKQTEIQEKAAKFQEKMQKSQLDIQKREQQLTEPIVTALRKLVKEVAEKRGYSWVFERNENLVLVHPEKDDLTSEVISLYDKK